MLLKYDMEVIYDFANLCKYAAWVVKMANVGEIYVNAPMKLGELLVFRIYFGNWASC